MIERSTLRTYLVLGVGLSLQAWLATAGGGCSSQGNTNAAPASSGAGTSGAGTSGAGTTGAGTSNASSASSSGTSSNSGTSNQAGSASAGSGASLSGSGAAEDDGGYDAANTDNNLGVGGITDAMAPVVGSGNTDGGPILAPSGTDLSGGPTPDVANLKYCTGTSPIHCFFGVTCSGMEFGSCPAAGSPAGAVGNYDVTFELGGAAAAKTSVEAEMHRPIVPEEDTTAGQTKRYAFSINVRWPEGEPQEDFQHKLAAGSPQYGEQGIDLLFNGPSPLITSIGVAPAAASDVVLYVAGDSTVCDQYGYPNFAGYGQVLPQIFHLGISVANYADSGESSASFVGNQGLWPAIMKVIKPNDVVFIEFGHNDKAISAAAFQTNMTKYVTDTIAAKAIPVLLTPIARASFNGTMVTPQFISSGGADIPAITRMIAMQMNVPLIDLTASTSAWLQQVGPNGWQAYHAGGPGPGADGTHTNAAGAAINVGFIRDAIQKLNIMPLVNYLR
jgi:lysophospholipase L1-like esterase